MVVEVPGASVPSMGLGFTQFGLLETDQSMDALPTLVSVNVLQGGLNGPPSIPLKSEAVRGVIRRSSVFVISVTGTVVKLLSASLLAMDNTPSYKPSSISAVLAVTSTACMELGRTLPSPGETESQSSPVVKRWQ